MAVDNSITFIVNHFSLPLNFNVCKHFCYPQAVVDKDVVKIVYNLFLHVEKFPSADYWRVDGLLKKMLRKKPFSLHNIRVLEAFLDKLRQKNTDPAAVMQDL